MWFKREFSDDLQTSDVERTQRVKYCDFIPPVDPSALELIRDTEDIRTHHSALIATMRSQIPATSQRVIQAPTFRSYLNKNSTEFTTYLVQFKDAVQSKLRKEVEAVVSRSVKWQQEGVTGWGVSGREVSEMLHHCMLASEKCSTFVGRESLLEDAKNIIRQSLVNNDMTMDVCMCIIGAHQAQGKQLLCLS